MNASRLSKVALAIVAVAAATLRLVAAEDEALRSVESLPLDRFDEYAANALPPWPWVRVGPAAPGLDLALRAEGESPFCGNRIAGKGVVAHSAYPATVGGAGIASSFTPPPEGDIYLGFDFLYRFGADKRGLDFTCRLSGPGSRELCLRIGEDDALCADGVDGHRVRIAALATNAWYHVSAVIHASGAVSATLTDFARNRDQHVPLSAFTVARPVIFTNLAFTCAAPDARSGSWMLDNVCMAGRADAPRVAWWPFVQAPLAELRASPRKVFAYYFIYTSGYSDEDPGLSWYTRTVLNPSTLPSYHRDRAGAGTELLYRPLPRPPMERGLPPEEVRIRGMEEEVRLAQQQGIDGFLVDFWDKPDPSNGQTTFNRNSFAILDAAARVDPGFKILPAVYSKTRREGSHGEADEGCDPVEYANSPVIRRICEHPATLRLGDGRVVLSEWLSERHSGAWWRKVLDQMATNGHPVAFLPQFNNCRRLEEFAPLAYAMADWGPRAPWDYDWIRRVRALPSMKCVFPVVEQDVRTRGCESFESRNSETLRHLWRKAIEESADWVFLYTWSDFSEQAMQPATCIGFAPYDLNAYYVQWFKTQAPPAIVRDRLYYFYRKHHTDAPQAKGDRWRFRPEGPRRPGEPVERNEIELLAFLRASGTLRIDAGGAIGETNAPAGITSFKVPLPVGKALVPRFTLMRNGRNVLSEPGHVPVLDRVEYPNLLYCSGVIAKE